MLMLCPKGSGPKEAARNLGGLLGIWVGRVSLEELSWEVNFLMGRRHIP
jgi:hypothetical protein